MVDKKELRIITLVMFPVCVTILPIFICKLYLHDRLDQFKLKGNLLEATRPYHRLKIQYPQIYINNADPSQEWVMNYSLENEAVRSKEN